MKAAIKRWVKALESGKFKQATGRLRRRDPKSHRTSYCCLGVLCQIEGLDRFGNFGYSYGESVSQDRLPKDFTLKLDISKDFEEQLIQMNDTDEVSFKEIAAYIRENI